MFENGVDMTPWPDLYRRISPIEALTKEEWMECWLDAQDESDGLTWDDADQAYEQAAANYWDWRAEELHAEGRL